MKNLLSTLVITLLCAVAAGPASAAQIGGLSPVDPTPWVPGEWQARVRQVKPHRVGDQYYTFQYFTVVAQTQQGCDQQLASMQNVTVVEYCHVVPY
jgi:hypothetical protein